MNKKEILEYVRQGGDKDDLIAKWKIAGFKTNQSEIWSSLETDPRNNSTARIIYEDEFWPKVFYFFLLELKKTPPKK